MKTQERLTKTHVTYGEMIGKVNDLIISAEATRKTLCISNTPCSAEACAELDAIVVKLGEISGLLAKDYVDEMQSISNT